VEPITKQREADQYLARAFFSAGIAPNVLDNPYVQRALQKVALVGNLYTPPGRRQVSGLLLETERKLVTEDIQEKRGAVSKRFGMTVVSDGASTCDRTPILNILTITPGVVEFVCAKDCRGNVKSSEYIAQLMIDYVTSLLDPFEVVQILMDNACRYVPFPAPRIAGRIMC
jgi:hypothetical protein